MLRAMLADRFKLVVHVEKREQPVYELLLARSDGRLGSGMQPSNVDCATKLEAQRVALEAAQAAGTPPPRPETPDLKAPPAPCTLRTLAAIIRDRGDGQGRLRFARGRDHDCKPCSRVAHDDAPARCRQDWLDGHVSDEDECRSARGDRNTSGKSRSRCTALDLHRDARAARIEARGVEDRQRHADRRSPRAAYGRTDLLRSRSSIQR